MEKNENVGLCRNRNRTGGRHSWWLSVPHSESYALLSNGFAFGLVADVFFFFAILFSLAAGSMAAITMNGTKNNPAISHSWFMK